MPSWSGQFKADCILPRICPTVGATSPEEIGPPHICIRKRTCPRRRVSTRSSGAASVRSRGGRVVAVSGDPVNKMVFYFGACAGGIWKTEDGGVFWRCVSDGFMGSSAVGSIAVAPSDPNVIYAGTGETAIRLDVSYGDGMLQVDRCRPHLEATSACRNSKFIGRICIHPTESRPRLCRGAGRRLRAQQRARRLPLEGWRQDLENGSSTAATSPARSTSPMDRNNPRILFASMWEAQAQLLEHFQRRAGQRPVPQHRRRRHLGGDLDASPACPTGMLGKIGVSISPARAGRVWALVEAEGDKTGLYRSDDYGERWTHGVAQPRPDAPALVLHPRLRRPRPRRHGLRHQPADVEVDRRRHDLQRGHDAARRQPRPLDRSQRHQRA